MASTSPFNILLGRYPSSYLINSVTLKIISASHHRAKAHGIELTLVPSVGPHM